MNKVSEIELVYRTKVKATSRPKINNADDAYKVLMDNWSPDRNEMVEEFKILLLNRANRVLGIVPISCGGTAGTVIDLKLIFCSAVKSNATGIILAHNHPSGNLMPSQTDCTMTKKIVKAGEILDIKILDHLIIATEGFYSFADENLL